MDLQTFIFEQETLKQLKRLRVAVDPQLEVAALCRREFAAGSNGRLLLFEQVIGSDFPLVANMFGSDKRAANMLRCRSLDEFSERLSSFMQKKNGTLQQRLQLPTALSVPATGTPCCQQVTAATDVTRLPAIRSWPGEQKPYLTLGLLLSRHPETTEMNLGLYRAQILDSKRIAINLAPGSGAAEHLRVAEKLQQPLPVSLLLGGDPAWIGCCRTTAKGL